ncbi:MAG: SDR family oxidoreductase [Pseudomonadota bacterium]
MIEQRTAIVTGGSSGIGAAAAKMLAQGGVRVCVTYGGNSAGAEETVAACLAAGADAFAIQGDVSDDAVCRDTAAQVMDRWGRIDVLLNNAGMTKPADARDLEALTADDFARLYAVNTIGVYQMIRACEAPLKASGQGSIVITSSIAGTDGVGSSLAYIASKGAVNSLTKALARSLAPTIRINAVCPGFVDSAWWAKTMDEAKIEKARASSRAMALLGRTASSEEVAEAVLFFALGARSITGQLLVVDNGMTLNLGQPLPVAKGA